MRKIASTKFMKGFVVTVPKAVREILDLRPGDYIDWFIDGDKIVIAKGERNVEKVK
jgi:AbrB family looped-hinge helix DNA binding protein